MSSKSKNLRAFAPSREPQKEEAKPTMVPKLRFPEFRGEERWRLGRLDSLCERIMDGTHFSPKSTEGPRPYLTSKNIRNGHLDLSTVTYISEEEHRAIYSRCPVKQNDVLLTKDGANTGNCAINCLDYEFSLLSSVAVLRANRRLIDPAFLFQSISSDRTRKLIEDSMGGQAITRVTLEKISGFAIPVANVAEQQKIAECLSSVDELMAAQARKVDALKTHKKGLMQQLFPREGETQLRLRFPEFQNAGEWEPKTLGDVVKSFKTGKLDANAMVENGQYRFYTCAKNYYQIDHYAFEGEALLVAGNGAHLGYIHHYIGKFNAYQRTYVLQDFKANVVFLRCLLDRYLPARIQFEKKDGNTPYIVLSTLTEMPLVIPRDPAEQQRIATCLSSLDALITAATQKHEALKTHKKGLMQQLFPSPEDTTNP